MKDNNSFLEFYSCEGGRQPTVFFNFPFIFAQEKPQARPDAVSFRGVRGALFILVFFLDLETDGAILNVVRKTVFFPKLKLLERRWLPLWLSC